MQFARPHTTLGLVFVVKYNVFPNLGRALLDSSLAEELHHPRVGQQSVQREVGGAGQIP